MMYERWLWSFRESGRQELREEKCRIYRGKSARSSRVLRQYLLHVGQFGYRQSSQLLNHLSAHNMPQWIVRSSSNAPIMMQWRSTISHA